MTSAGLPAPIEGTEADLPAAVAAAMANPGDPERGVTPAAGIPWAWLAWGDPTNRPLLLVHGVTSSAQTFWRVGPALAAAGRRVVAVDQAGHGLTGHWQGHHRFRDNAADLAAFARQAGLAADDGRGGDPAGDLAVVGHSWGAMTAAALPVAGLRPGRLVLLDPPVLQGAELVAMTEDPVEQSYDTVTEAVATIAAANPTWDRRDVLAKANGLVLMDEAAVRAVLLENGDWDGGLADLRHPAAARQVVRIVRGDRASGGLLPDDRLADLAATIGAGSILTVAGAGHSPQRTHPAATVAALLRALGELPT